ncbi:MAG: M56 family metallopeptidase [Acutalibacter sp.]|nr:M56 family metallopeptidase [Acutalibacter sp.]
MNIEVSFFSVCMGILFSSFFIVAVHLLRNNKAFLKGFGVITVLVLHVLSLCRMLLPADFPFTEPIRVEKIYNDIYLFLAESCGSIAGREFSILDILLWIWFFVSGVCLVYWMFSYCRNMHHFGRFRNNRNLLGEEILKVVQKETSRKMKIHLMVYPTLDGPKSIGLFKKIILLPAKDYSNEELFSVLVHEYAHFLNHDLWIKFLAKLFQCLFWWNPLIILLQHDLSQILEIKCDFTVRQVFSKFKKTAYMQTLIRVYEDESKPKENTHKGIIARILSFFSLKLFHGKFKNLWRPFWKREKPLEKTEIYERFDMLSNPGKPVALFAQILFYILCAIVIVWSYSFIFQPFYEAPTEEIYTDSFASEGDMFEGYVLKCTDHTYYIVTDSGDLHSITKDAAETFIACGYPFKEE